jgi:hypothetical protein
MKLFRDRLLGRLIEQHALSEYLARMLLAWRHPGFSAHVGEASPFEAKKRGRACYMMGAPMSLKKLVYLDGLKAVLYRSHMNPSLGRNFEAVDPSGMAGALGRPHSRRRQTAHALVCLPGQVLAAGAGGADGAGRASPRQGALSAELCEAHQ